MRNNGERVCDVCGELIMRGAAFHVGILAPEVAASLLDVDDVNLVPTWTQLPDLTVRLDFCTGCYHLMGDPECLLEMR